MILPDLFFNRCIQGGSIFLQIKKKTDDVFQIIENIIRFRLSPTGRVSCNVAEQGYGLDKLGSSPTGRVSCNNSVTSIGDDVFRFVPYGACELQWRAENAF